jgi:hypothetical protein
MLPRATYPKEHFYMKSAEITQKIFDIIGELMGVYRELYSKTSEANLHMVASDKVKKSLRHKYCAFQA